jgi:hypothetical protein
VGWNTIFRLMRYFRFSWRLIWRWSDVNSTGTDSEYGGSGFLRNIDWYIRRHIPGDSNLQRCLGWKSVINVLRAENYLVPLFKLKSTVIPRSCFYELKQKEHVVTWTYLTVWLHLSPSEVCIVIFNNITTTLSPLEMFYATARTLSEVKEIFVI